LSKFGDKLKFVGHLFSFFVQLTSQRQNLLIPGLVSDWSNLFEANHALFIDQKAFRRTVNSVVDRRASFGIVNRLGVGIAGLGQELNRRRSFVAGVVRILVIDPIDGKAF
jgi:hypothetical protein